MESKLELLERDMKRFYDIHVENWESLRKKAKVFRNLRKDIFCILEKYLRNRRKLLTRIAPFGSYQSGTSKLDSDIDIVICIEKLAEDIYDPDEKEMKNLILERLHERLPIRRNYERMRHIKDAVVPIIRGFLDGVGFDLSIHFGSSVPLGYTAAKFLKTVVKFQPEFPILLHFIKGWLRSHVDLGKLARSMVPNSYALSLLIVFFLQNYALIPNLHAMYPIKFDPKNATWNFISVSEKEIALWEKKQTGRSVEQKLPSKLFVDFLKHYNKYPIDTFFINMSEGILERKSKTKTGLKIKDPYDPCNPGRSMFNSDDFQNLINNTHLKINTPDSRSLIDDIWEFRSW